MSDDEKSGEGFRAVKSMNLMVREFWSKKQLTFDWVAFGKVLLAAGEFQVAGYWLLLRNI